MSKIQASLDHKRIRRLIWLVLTVFVLLGYSLQSVAGIAYYSNEMQNIATVSSPPVILQNGTAGASTIYANNTSAKVSVEAPLFDYVDNNDPDVDSSADKGMHSNFPAQQAGPDSTYDTLAEENTEGIEDYVDNNTSDMDNSSDVGSHSNFENQKDYDSNYDTLTEQNTAGGGITKVGIDTNGTGNNLPLSFSHTLVSGTDRIVIVCIGVENGDTIDVSTVTYGGVTMTLAVEGITSTTGFRFLCEIWYILENDLPSDGSQTVEITCSGTPYELEVNGFCAEYTGVAQGTPEDYDNTDEPTPGDDTIENTGLSFSTGAWVVSAVGCGNGGSFAHAQSQVEVLDFLDASSTFAVAELRGADSETTLVSTYATGANRLERVCAGWAVATEEDNYELDLEIRFTDVIDFLSTETLCISTGTFSGTEDINVDFWNGSGWENLATDLTAYSSNEYTVSLTSENFTIRFKGGTESSDTTQDQWQIDASLLRVEGAGSKEDAVDNDTSNEDGSDDVGTLSNFDNMKTKDGMANLTEGEVGGGTVWLWQEDTSGYIPTSSFDTFQFWSSWTTNSTTSGTITKIGIYVFANPGNSPQVKLGIYDDSGGSPNNLLGETNVATITAVGWLDLDIVGGGLSISASTTYHISHITDIGPITQWRYYKTATPVSDYRDSRVWPNLFDPAGSTTKSSSYRYSAYRVGYDEPPDYRLDQEVQWTDVPYSLPNEELCIYAGTMGAEDITVDVWNGSAWINVLSDMNASAWNNVTMTSYLTSSTFTIRFKGGNETGDLSQDIWEIDVALIHVWSVGGESYELDLEVQWTGADYTQTNEELCIKAGTFSGSENIQVRVWNNTGNSWHWVMNLTASQWNNVSITSYLTSSTFTVQFLGGIETGDTTQDGWNIDATLLHVWTNVQAPTSWLSGWDERVKITIDSNDVDNPLSNFPVLVHLSNSSGRNNDDATFVFDEVGSNSKKIAVATSDGTQCYVEIERWDDASEQAWLWVKVPSIGNTTDTELYLYYDIDHADNTVYVGETGSTAAQNVWDSSFKGVWHLSETSGGVGAIKDSTSNNNAGTDNGNPTFNATGRIDSAISFDGFDDYINMSNSASLQFTSSLTIEAWINLESFGSGYDVDVVLRKGGDNPNDYQLAIHDQKLALIILEGDDAGLESSANLTATTWYYLAGTWNGSIRKVYLNGYEDGSGSKTGPISPDTRDIYIGGRSGTDLSTGVVDEVRASNTSRSAAWIKASYESERDDLLVFGSEETCGRAENYDFVLQVANQVANNWTINLQVYNSSNLARLSKAIISFHDGTSSDQTIVSDGSITQSEGSQYNLAGNATIYISMSNLQATTTGTSYLYVYLKIQVPNTSTYMLYTVNFEIT